MPISASDFIRDIDKLAIISDSCFRAIEIAGDESCSALDIANEIAKDPLLTANILKIANSAFYGFRAKVDNLPRAISIIGTTDLIDLMTVVSAIHNVDKLNVPHLNISQFWTHSLFVGLLEKELARFSSTKILHRERLFTAGVLHELGRVVMALKISELFQVMQQRAIQSGEAFHVVEKLVFDLGHEQVGAALLKKWLFPDSLVSMVRHHYEPEGAGQYSLETSILHIANELASTAGMVGIVYDARPAIAEFAWQITGISEENANKAMEEARSLYRQSASLFLPKARFA